jgi:glutaredoxin
MEEKRIKIKQIEKKGIWGIKYSIIPSYIEKENFFNKDEYKLYICLKEIFKNTKIDIFPEVALNQIIKINTKRDYKKLYNNYCDRSIDFTIYDNENEKIICCIELNGESHEIQKRKERDEFLKEAFEFTKIPLIFIKSKNYYNQQEIKNIIEKNIQNSN